VGKVWLTLWHISIHRSCRMSRSHE